VTTVTGKVNFYIFFSPLTQNTNQ